MREYLSKQDLRDRLDLAKNYSQYRTRTLRECTQRSIKPPNNEGSFSIADPWESTLDTNRHEYRRGNIIGIAETSLGGTLSRYTQNEDVFTCHEAPHASILTVIDGGGGSSSGRAAAILSALSLEQYLDTLAIEDPDSHITPRQMDAILNEVNQELLDHEARLDDRSVRLFGTIAGACFLHNEEGRVEKMITFARGDSRTLVIRGGRILREGSTVLQNHASALAIMHADPAKYWGEFRDRQSRIMDGLGIQNHQWNSSMSDPSLQNHARLIDVQPGDAVILYTDGIGDMVSDYELEECARIAGRGNGIHAPTLHKLIMNLARRRNETPIDEECIIQTGVDSFATIVPNPTYIDRDGNPLPPRGSSDNQTLAVCTLS